MKQLTYNESENAFILTDPRTNKAVTIRPHEALILANAAQSSLLAVRDGARVMVRV